MRLVLSLILFILCGQAISQTIRFQRAFGDSAFNGGRAFPTLDSGYILAGTSDIGNFSPYTPKGFILKTDSLGSSKWIRTYDKPGYSSGSLLMGEVSKGEYFIQQSFYFGSAWNHSLIIKIDSQGDTLLVKRNGVYAERIFALSGKRYILTSGITLAEVDSSFNIIWHKNYTGFQTCQAAERTLDGGYIFLGSIKTGSGPNNLGLHVLKTDSLGNTKWSRSYSHPNGYITPTGGSIQGIVPTSDKGYILTGRDSINPFLEEILVIKTDSLGMIQWSRNYGGTGYDAGLSIRENGGAIGYIFTASTMGVESPQNSSRTIMVRTDFSGNVLWAKMYGSVFTNPMNAGDFGNVIELAKDGGYIFSGITQSMGFGFYDGWMVKTDQNGNSGCNEISANVNSYPVSLIIGSGGTDTSITPIPFLNDTVIIGTMVIHDSVICPASPVIAACTASTDTVFTGNASNLSAGASGGLAPFTYNWSPSAGLTNTTIAAPVARPTISTCYTVTITDQTGSYDYCTECITVLTGVQEFDHQIQVSVYPNPTEGLVQVSASSSVFKEFEVIDVCGKVIQAGKWADKNQWVDFTGYQPGIYILRLISGQQALNRKVIRR